MIQQSLRCQVEETWFKQSLKSFSFIFHVQHLVYLRPFLLTFEDVTPIYHLCTTGDFYPLKLTFQYRDTLSTDSHKKLKLTCYYVPFYLYKFMTYFCSSPHQFFTWSITGLFILRQNAVRGWMKAFCFKVTSHSLSNLFFSVLWCHVPYRTNEQHIIYMEKLGKFCILLNFARSPEYNFYLYKKYRNFLFETFHCEMFYQENSIKFFLIIYSQMKVTRERF